MNRQHSTPKYRYITLQNRHYLSDFFSPFVVNANFFLLAEIGQTFSSLRVDATHIILIIIKILEVEIKVLGTKDERGTVNRSAQCPTVLRSFIEL